MYLNVVELAESMGVEEKVVEGWVRYEGLPHVHDRGRLLFDRAQVVTWAVSRGLAAKVGFLAPSQVEGATPLERMMRAGGVWRDVAPQKVLEVLAEIAGRLPGASRLRCFLSAPARLTGSSCSEQLESADRSISQEGMVCG